ncbi:MAG TPA: nucleotidyltransferase family protein, partial [Acidimicrobiales bacterium]|nr:nucleotidyltransferase family protein [Acidimicrobiales bacterium]
RVEDLVELQRLRSLLLVPEVVGRALQPLVAAGLEPVVWKGPAVADRYPGAGLRLFEDLDVLVPRHEHERALSALRAAGWMVEHDAAPDRYDRVLRHPDTPGMPVELHYEFEARHDRLSTLRADELWARRVPGRVAGVDAFVLAPSDELVMLAAHAAKPFHCFARLMWIADLAMVLGYAEEAGPSVDWPDVVGRAASAECATALSVALAMAGHAGAPVPPGVVSLPRRGWRATALDRLVDPMWALAPAPPIHLRFALADSAQRRLALLAGFTHGYPALTSVGWYARSVGFVARRWHALRAPEAAGARSS